MPPNSNGRLLSSGRALGHRHRLRSRRTVELAVLGRNDCCGEIAALNCDPSALARPVPAAVHRASVVASSLEVTALALGRGGAGGDGARQCGAGGDGGGAHRGYGGFS